MDSIAALNDGLPTANGNLANAETEVLKNFKGRTISIRFRKQSLNCDLLPLSGRTIYYYAL